MSGRDHDVAYARDAHQYFAMFYLTDTSPENGCLRALPGTHRKPHPMHDVLANVEAHSDTQRSDDGIGPEHGEADGSVDICVKAGDVVLGKLPRYRWDLACILLKMPAISLPTGMSLVQRGQK